MKIRGFCAHILKNNSIVLSCYNTFYKTINRKSFYEEVMLRERMSIFEYEKLAAPIPYFPIERMRDSNYYGYARALKSYAGLDSISSAIEHGIYLGDRIVPAEKMRATRSVIAMSENRIQAFKKHNIQKPIVAIGPYIHYATPLLNQEKYESLKNKLGKVLLVMPVHAAKAVKVTFNHSTLIDYIEAIRHEFDNVLICLHFRDILNNPHCAREYEEMGYKVVSAGNEYDYNFINRLKSIILLSDYVLSNSHGTNTGFCTYLNKPQTIIYDKDIKKIHSAYNDEVQMIRDAQVREIEDAFSDYCYVITDYQRTIIEKYWGLSLIKSPKELKECIETLNTI